MTNITSYTATIPFLNGTSTSTSNVTTAFQLVTNASLTQTGATKITLGSTAERNKRMIIISATVMVTVPLLVVLFIAGRAFVHSLKARKTAPTKQKQVPNAQDGDSQRGQEIELTEDPVHMPVDDDYLGLGYPGDSRTGNRMTGGSRGAAMPDPIFDMDETEDYMGRTGAKQTSPDRPRKEKSKKKKCKDKNKGK